MRKSLLAAVAIGLTAMAPAANASVSIANGSFENGTNPGSSFANLAAGSNAIDSWKIGDGGVDYIGGYWQAQGGSARSIDLAGNSAGSISQDLLGLVVNQVYDVTFWLSGNPDGPIDPVKVAVVSAGAIGTPFSYILGPTNSHSNMHWQEFHYIFTALSTTATLKFSAGGDPKSPYGAALDNVSIAAVPEAATWAMMILGFGLAGASLRHRKRKFAFA